MDDVEVHYGSSEPSRQRALAYTRGTEIHLGPSQERHLPHEAWHVVQQKQGRVRPTVRAEGVAVNDDEELEREADAFGADAARVGFTLGAGAGGGLPAQRQAPGGPLLPREPERFTPSGELALQKNGDNVVRMEIEPRSRRVVLITETGTRYTGTVDTDLAPGRYELSANTARRRWNVAGARGGERFDLTLESADPWLLSYADIVSLNVSDEPTLSLPEIQSRLGLLDAILARLQGRYAGAPATAAVIAQGRTGLSAFRSQLRGVPDEVRALLLAEDVVERAERAILLLDQQRTTLIGQTGYLAQVDRVERLYVDALGRVFQADLASVFNRADEGARGLPRAFIEVDLTRIQQHANLNRELLVPSEQLYQWVNWVRGRLDAFETLTQSLARARQAQAPNVTQLEQQVEREAQLIQLSIEGLGQFDTALRAREYMIRERVMDPILTGAMNRIMHRVGAIMAASRSADAADLQRRVASLRADQNVATFYRALPAMIGVSRMVTALAVSFVASWAAASVGGLVGGGVMRTVVQGGALTMRGGLTMAGAVTLEALTFTLVNQGLGTVLLGQRPTARDLLVDFAWSLGLFSVMRGLSVGIGRGLSGTGMAALGGPIQTAGSFPLLQGYGFLRFRVERGRWPSGEEVDQMTAQNVLMLAGLAVGMRAVQRWLPGNARRPTALEVFRQRYGWRFETIEAGRQRLIEEIGQLVAAGRATDQAAFDAIRPRARVLEEEYARILAEAAGDVNINLTGIRAQLKQARTTVIEGQAELLERELGLAAGAGLRSAGSDRAYTYRAGKTNDLEGRLRALGARVTKTQDTATGQRTLTAQFGNEPPLTFQERARPAYGAREVSVDASNPAVQTIYTSFSINDPAAQRMVVHMITEQLANSPQQTVEWAARQVTNTLTRMRRAAPTGTTVESLVLNLRSQGILASAAPAPLVTQAQGLARAGILNSTEWLSARTAEEDIGVVGEWLSRSVLQGAAPAGARVYRNIRFIGDVFTDPAGTTPRQMSSGRPAVNTDVAELDFMTAEPTGSDLTVLSVTNVKAVAGLVGEANAQNTNALSCIRTPRGQLVAIRDGAQTYYARVRSVEAVEMATDQTVDVTGRLQEARGGARAETLGPQGARGYTGSLGRSAADIRTLARLLREIQFTRSSAY